MVPAMAFLRKILRIEPGVSLAQWVYDTIAANWPRLVALFVAGGGMTYLSAITEWTQAIGPAGIGLLVIFTILLVNLLLSQAQALRAKAREKNALATASAAWVESTDGINPLDAHFQKKRIRIEDIAHPLGRHVTGKKFSECQLVGPANVAFIRNCTLIGMSFGNCDMILTKKAMQIYNVIPFFDCSLLGGELINATIYVHPDMLDQLKTTPGLKFVNLTGDPDLDSL
jgi:hypothetical protein